ncbi:leucine-rich repeat domain-containing protein [Ruminococcus sp.]|uniref:leucine-rich repeat domain-containing protein n=1 Tax=Ruminococcus sp. TaxID=41978 RepID=UPI002B618347|nr:leucine-rich repeat domain-containing protein [Ruminococcus sp.]HOH86269.1 leucine-rich repeat domain-containing protein [Ruminococcus sp.]
MEHTDGFVINGEVLEAYNGSDTEVSIPTEVTRIGSGAFRRNRNIVTVAVPEGITEIGIGAFQGCTALTEVQLPDSVTIIGDRAFQGCESLAAAKLPAGLTEIGDHAFEGTKISVTCFPGSLKRIGKYAFYGLRSIKSLIFCHKPEVIDDHAFADCDDLWHLEFRESVGRIGEKAFSGCNRLEKITIPHRLINSSACADNAFADTPFQRRRDGIKIPEPRMPGVMGWVQSCGGQVISGSADCCIARFYHPKERIYEIQFYYRRTPDSSLTEEHIRLKDYDEAMAMLRDSDKVWTRIYDHLKTKLKLAADAEVWKTVEDCRNTPDILSRLSANALDSIITFLTLKPKYRIVQSDHAETERFYRVTPHRPLSCFDSQPVEMTEISKSDAQKR